jgi:hypothetical protein
MKWMRRTTESRITECSSTGNFNELWAKQQFTSHTERQTLPYPVWEGLLTTLGSDLVAGWKM